MYFYISISLAKKLQEMISAYIYSKSDEPLEFTLLGKTALQDLLMTLDFP
jgi:hypothetical protein